MPEESVQNNIIKFFREIRLTKTAAIKIALGVALTLALAWMFPRGESIELDYKVGGVWVKKDLISPFSYPIYRDEHEYQMDVEEAKKRVYPVFERDVQAGEQQLAMIDKLFTQLRDAVRLREQYKRSRREHKSTILEDSAAFSRSASQLNVAFSDREWDLLAGMSAGQQRNRLDVLKKGLSSGMQEYLHTGILDRPKNTLSRPEIALRKGTVEEIIPVARLYDRTDIVTVLETDLLSLFKSDQNSIAIAYRIGLTVITPNIKFNAAAIDIAIQAAVEAVPRTIGFVQENERVVSKHERITGETKLKLESLRRARAERGPETNILAQFAGIMLHVTIVVMLYGIYLFLFRKRIFGSNRLLALIALIILMEGFFAYLTRELNANAPLEFLILVPAASMLLTIIFDSRVGFYGTVIVSFLVAGIRGNDYTIALASLVAGALSVYTVRDMKNRTQIFRSMTFIAIGYASAITALDLERFEPVNILVEQLTFGLTNAIISPVLTYGLLIFFERVFNVTTDLALIELAHFNHPLLRLLAERAPGTYHHSIAMANLTEAAASAVGANEVLARVGAYFHDIGKTVKPTYFVENQRGSRSRHDKLAPRMSSLIILAHVKDGIALAREHGLPEEIIDCIPMHHGTTRIDYFYDKALRLAQSSDDETKIIEINEQDYRYPGPKPQTKETGILMLADGIEATARTLEDPSPQKLEVAIDELIKKRFVEGELDECPLTLKDLTKIKAAFLNVLVGTYHVRVKYPDAKKKRPPKAEPKQEQPVQEGDLTPDERLSRTIKEIDKE